MQNKRLKQIRVALLAMLGMAALASSAYAEVTFRSASSAAKAGSPAFRSAASAAVAGGPKFRAASSAATNTASLSLNRPAGTVANDVMIASVSVRPSTVTIGAPSGWTLVRRVDQPTGQPSSLAVYRKVAGGSEPSSYAWSVTGAGNAAGGIQAFFGADTANPIDVENGQATPSSLSHPTPSVTTTVANTMIVTAHSFPTSTTWTPPALMNEALDTQYQPVASGQGQSIEANYVLQGAAGATGAKTAVAAGGSGNADYGATHILALRPAASPVLSINLPAGTAANDVLIASVGLRPSSAAISAPAGWTLVRRVDNATGQTDSLAVYRKVAGGSEPSSYAWGVSGADYATGGIQAFVNVDTANPIDVENGAATADGLTHATPSVTTTAANAMIVSSHTFATSTTWTPPAGMTEAFDSQYQPVPSGQGKSIEANYVLQAVAGATGVKSATAASGPDIGAAHILALRAAAPTLTIALPAGAVANDVLVASVAVRPSSATIGAPAGWTLVRRVDNAAGQTNSLAVFRKVGGSSEPGSYGWNVTGAEYAVGGIQAFSGVDMANPIDVENGQTTPPDSITHATPSITTTVANAMLVTSHTFATSTTWTPPAGMTEAFDIQYQPVPSGQGQSIEGDYVLQAAAGATGAKTATAASGPDIGATHILALRPGNTAVALYYIQADHLNTPREIYDGSGQLRWRWEQAEPFGVNVPDEDPSSLGAFEFPVRFPGQYFDKETNLAYNGARDGYNPSIGSYTQPEPLGLYGDINLYRYARSSPLIHFDPDGRQAASALGGALGGGARGSALGLPGLIGGVALGALVPWMCQVTDRDRCERRCDRDYDWDQKQCEWLWKMRGRDPNVMRECMDRVRQVYLDCYRDCAK